MSRAAAAVIGAAMLLLGSVLLIWRWEALRLSPTFIVLALLAIVGVPAALWLSLGPRPSPRPRRLPRTFWIGAALLGAGILGLGASLLTSFYNYPATLPVPDGSHRSAHFARLPKAVAAQFHLLFPRLVVGRSLKVSDGSYEVWLKQPGAARYRLQAQWRGGGIQLENLSLNAVYTDGAPGPSSGRRYKGYYGPVAFPGYLLYVSTATARYWTVSRTAEGIPEESGGGW